MHPFSISEIYLNENKRTININNLPQKYCSFDCIFCPCVSTECKTDEVFPFDETKAFLERLEVNLKTGNIDLVFFDPNGDSLADKNLLNIVNLIKKFGIKLKIIANGYLFNDDKYKSVLNKFDEVIGELAVTNEKDFQKIQRPLKGYTFKKYVANMTNFNAQYSGKFILDITILKNISDSEESISKFKEYIKIINPDKVLVGMPTNEKIKKVLGIDNEKLKMITNELCNK